MPNVSIKIDGIDKVLRKLGTVRGQDMLAEPMEASLRILQADMQNYPVQRTGSTYIRTGTLGRRWAIAPIERTGNGLHGRVGNNTEYAPFVQSNILQSAVHRGRWQTDAQVVQRRRAWIVARFKRAIDQALNRSA